MTWPELFRRRIARQPVERCGFWLGRPHPDTRPILNRHFGAFAEEELRLKEASNAMNNRLFPMVAFQRWTSPTL